MFDIYKTAQIRKTRAGINRKANFLTELFFGVEQTVEDEQIILEITKGQNKMAPFVSPVEDGRVMYEKKQSSNIVTAPSIAPKHVLTGKDYFTRLAGMGLSATVAERQAENLGDILAKQEKYIANKIEFIVGQFLTNGKVMSEGTDFSYEIDYQMGNIATLEAGLKWTDTGINPLDTIEEYVSIAEESGELVKNVVLGKDAAKALSNNATLNEELDIKNKTQAVLDMRKKFPGIVYLGHFNKMGVDLWSYHQTVVDGKGDKKNIIPTNIMIGGPQLGEILYAPIVYFDEGKGQVLHMQKRHSRDNIAPNGKEKSISTESRPVLAPLDLDSYFSVVVV